MPWEGRDDTLDDASLSDDCFKRVEHNSTLDCVVYVSSCAPDSVFMSIPSNGPPFRKLLTGQRVVSSVRLLPEEYVMDLSTWEIVPIAMDPSKREIVR